MARVTLAPPVYLRVSPPTKAYPEGTLVTIELNEAGAVIDLHRADSGDDNK